MKHFTLAIFLFIALSLKAQVGIGTTNPTSELEISAGASGIPVLKLNPQTTPIGTTSGQLSVIGDQLYLYDSTRGKWLSVGSSTFNFGLEGGLNSGNLEYSGDIKNSGPRMVHDGTIVYVTLNSSGGNPSKKVTINVYDNSNTLINKHTLELDGGKLIAPDFNVDFSAGNYFRVDAIADAGGNVNDLSIVLWTKRRK